MNKERLLNVAKALRESPNPDHFDMRRYVNQCGTPACAFGHYAARDDLQDAFSINTTQDPNRWPHQGVYLRATAAEIHFGRPEVLSHFDLAPWQLNELFGSADDYEEDGDYDELSVPSYARLARTCKTPGEAADYIERFVAQNG
jgi:hypothetical protein